MLVVLRVKEIPPDSSGGNFFIRGYVKRVFKNYPLAFFTTDATSFEEWPLIFVAISKICGNKNYSIHFLESLNYN
jgi:hypothetical protein